jgi:hypothetical protein
MLLGNALLAKGKPAEALKAVETAVSLDPAIPDADLMLGYAQAAAGKADDAEKSFRKSISATPGDLRPSMALVRLLVTSGKRDAARAEIHTLRQTKLPADAEEALRKLESQLEK